jgi:hypothetical protein
MNGDLCSDIILTMMAVNIKKKNYIKKTREFGSKYLRKVREQ